MIKNGALGVKPKPTDFLITGSWNLPKLDIMDNIRFEYNQGKSLDCTLYASFGALSDAMNYEFSAEEIKEMVEMSYDRGRKRGKGRYTHSAVKVVVDYWNERNPKKPVAYYMLDLGDDKLVEDIINKNHTLITTHQGNAKYVLDFYTDGVLDEYEFGSPTYGHAVDLISKRRVKDSYKGRGGVKVANTNIYKVKHPMSKLISSGVYYPTAYLIVPINSEARIEELKRLAQFKVLVEENIKNNSEMRHLTNSQEYKDRLHEINNELRKKLDDIQVEFNKIS